MSRPAVPAPETGDPTYDRRRPDLRSAPHPAPSPAAAAQVTVSPSRSEVRRADPSLSFRVVAPGARGFDVIVTTEPALFDPANAHRRTPKNFRSSRQDFRGEVIEIEIGFYLLTPCLSARPHVGRPQADPALLHRRRLRRPRGAAGALLGHARGDGVAGAVRGPRGRSRRGQSVEHARRRGRPAGRGQCPRPGDGGGGQRQRDPVARRHRWPAARSPGAAGAGRPARRSRGAGFRTASGRRTAARYAPSSGHARPRPAQRLRASPGGDRRRRVAASGGGQWRDTGAYGRRGRAGLLRRGLCLTAVAAAARLARRYRDLDIAHATSSALYDDGFGDATTSRRGDADSAARSSAGGAERAAEPAGERSRVHARERQRGGRAGRRRRGGGPAGRGRSSPRAWSAATRRSASTAASAAGSAPPTPTTSAPMTGCASARTRPCRTRANSANCWR